MLTTSLELEAVEDGDIDGEDDVDEGEEEEELDDTLLRETGRSTLTSSEKLLLHSSSGSTSRVTSFPVKKKKTQIRDIQLSKDTRDHNELRS